MAAGWGDSWGSSWGDSWGASAGVSTCWGDSWGNSWGDSWGVITGAPVAAFTGSPLTGPAPPLTGPAPLTETFTDQSTNTPTSWIWAFGDGGTSTQQNPVYVYASPGTYTVSLSATNAAGTGSLTKIAYITISPEPINVNVPWDTGVSGFLWDKPLNNFQWSFEMAVTSSFVWHVAEDRLFTFTPKTPTNISGWTISLAVYDREGGSIVPGGGPFAATITDAINGVFTEPLSSSNTSTIGRLYGWLQVRRTNSGFNTVLADGPVTAKP